MILNPRTENKNTSENWKSRNGYESQFLYFDSESINYDLWVKYLGTLETNHRPQDTTYNDHKY